MKWIEKRSSSSSSNNIINSSIKSSIIINRRRRRRRRRRSISIVIFVVGWNSFCCWALESHPLTAILSTRYSAARKDRYRLYGSSNTHHHHYHHHDDNYAVVSPARRSALFHKNDHKNNENNNDKVRRVRYSEFLSLVNRNEVKTVSFSPDGTQLIGRLKKKEKKSLLYKPSLWSRIRRKLVPARSLPESLPESLPKSLPESLERRIIEVKCLPEDPELLSTLTKHKVDISVSPTSRWSWLRQFALPLSFFAGLFFLLSSSSRRLTNNNNNKTPPFLLNNNNNNDAQSTTFANVAGCSEAKTELAELVDFLRRPEEYSRNGATLPRGVLLEGPPGTGKTLLAKAVAGEADVPFFALSASEFIELYVGVGASRVREVFQAAKRHAPCIVFLDEVDAVGRQRGAGFAGGNDEREQTINQLLVEMDGFDNNSGVITLAATNRADVLDEALLRPGRFDRVITVDLPDLNARLDILKVHSKGKPLDPDVDLSALARRTPGFSGAQLAQLMNEAALHAARKHRTTIGWYQIDSALDRILLGLEKSQGSSSSSLHSQHHNELVAYHESGHAICAALLPDYDQVQKISIVPRSNGVGGLTSFSPQESRLNSGMYTKQYLQSKLVVALGGRVAEEFIFGENMVTVGATDDLKHVTTIARRMVKEWGMSNTIGPISLTHPTTSSSTEGPFMGRQLGIKPQIWGNKLSKQVNDEVIQLIHHAYLKAKQIITQNESLLHHLAQTLVEQEIVTSEEFQCMIVLFNANIFFCDDNNIIDGGGGGSTNEYSDGNHFPFQHFPDQL